MSLPLFVLDLLVVEGCTLSCLRMPDKPARTIYPSLVMIAMRLLRFGSTIVAAMLISMMFSTLVAVAQEVEEYPRWLPKVDNGDSRWVGIDCADSLHCLISAWVGLGIENHFLLTNDGGESWRVVNSDSDSQEGLALHTTDVAFPAPGVALAVADKGYIYRSLDTGQTWALHRLPGVSESPGVPGFLSYPPHLSMSDIDNGVVAITFILGDTAQAVCYGTENGGESWEQLPTNPIPPGWTWSAVDALLCLDVGHYLCVVSDNRGNPQLAMTMDGGATWHFSLLPEREGDPSVYDDGVIYKLAFERVDASTAFVSGSHQLPAERVRSYLARTDDGGESWRVIHHDQIEGEHGGMSDVAFRDDMNGLAIAFGSIARTTDGGTTWTRDSVKGLKPSTTVAGMLEWLTESRALFIDHSGTLFVWDASVSSIRAVDARGDVLSCALLATTDDGVELRLDLAEPERVRVVLWSAIGTEVAAFDAGWVDDADGRVSVPLPAVPSGSYYLQVSAGERSRVVPLRRVD